MSNLRNECSSNVAGYVRKTESTQESTTLVDPAINALFNSLMEELKDKRNIIEKQRGELEALKFSPYSSIGLKLVAKCSALKSENEELGQYIEQGIIEKHRLEIALQNQLIIELKRALKESYAYAASLDREIEALQDELFSYRKKIT